MTLSDILRGKGRQVFCISPAATLREVVEEMVEHHCGSLVVTRDDELLGIITERDVLQACIHPEVELSMRRVADHMTTEVQTASPDASVAEVMGLMTRHRIRHLPVVEGGRLAGLISIGDVVKAQFEALHVENHYLWSYLHS